MSLCHSITATRASSQRCAGSAPSTSTGNPTIPSLATSQPLFNMNAYRKNIISIVLSISAITLSQAAESQPTLCLASEKIIFQFEVLPSRKIAAICQDGSEQYLTYRFGQPYKIELQHPNKLNNTAWQEFEFDGYSRGGGIENEAMGSYQLSFSKKDTTYTLFQDWHLPTGEYNIGIFIHSPKGRFVLRGDQKSQIGALTTLETQHRLKAKPDPEEPL